MPDCKGEGLQHDWVFLRQAEDRRREQLNPGYCPPRWHVSVTVTDRFYCRRCLVYIDRLPSIAPRDEAAHEPLADVVAHHVAEERAEIARSVLALRAVVPPRQCCQDILSEVANSIRARSD